MDTNPHENAPPGGANPHPPHPDVPQPTGERNKAGDLPSGTQAEQPKGYPSDARHETEHAATPD